MKSSWTWHLVVAFVGIPVGIGLAMALDRYPPYYRMHGEIMAAAPEDCGLPAYTATPDIKPGHCVYVKWDIKVVRECEPVKTGVARVIEVSGIKHELPKLPLRFGGNTGSKISNPLIRPWVYPDAEWANQEGTATYYSSACYVCPFGPIANPMHKINPVCVNKPSIRYSVTQRV